jgi:hypothetical protein
MLNLRVQTIVAVVIVVVDVVVVVVVVFGVQIYVISLNTTGLLCLAYS